MGARGHAHPSFMTPTQDIRDLFTWHCPSQKRAGDNILKKKFQLIIKQDLQTTFLLGKIVAATI